jgi:hypothetical protein
MSNRWRVLSQARSWLICGTWLIAVLLIRPVQDRIDTLLAGTAPNQDVLYFGSPVMMEKLSLGYRSFIADIYWMRTIQYYGRREEAARRPVRYKNLAALLDITTTLDPDLVDAYRAGSTFLAEPDPAGAGQPYEAVRLLDKGISRHPQDWRYPFDKGFIYFWFLKDFKTAGEIWLAASRLPNVPAWMQGLAAMSMSKGGAMEAARSLWQRQYQESDRVDVRENALNHLLSIQVAEDLWTLEYLIQKYLQKTGILPWRLGDLVRAGLAKRIPLDPLGMPYQYLPERSEVRLDPHSQIRYLAMPAIYREAFLEKLARQNPSP